MGIRGTQRCPDIMEIRKFSLQCTTITKIFKRTGTGLTLTWQPVPTTNETQHVTMKQINFSVILGLKPLTLLLSYSTNQLKDNRLVHTLSSSIIIITIQPPPPPPVTIIITDNNHNTWS
jgi:hypothetical protein